MPELCQQLEAYLSRDLDDSSIEQFQQHLQSCATCAEAVEFDRQLRREFRELSESSEEPSPELRDRVRLLLHPPATAAVDSQVSRRRALAVVVAGGLTLALTLNVMISWSGENQDRIDQTPAVEAVQQHQDPSTNTGSSQPSATIIPPTVELADSLLGVPVKSDDPNVTILLVYPASPDPQATVPQSNTTERSAPLIGRSRSLSQPIAITYHQ